MRVWTSKTFLMSLVLLLTAPACKTSQEQPSISLIHGQDWAQIGERVLSQKLNIQEFRHRGPFKVRSHRHITLPISPKDSFEGDYFQPRHKGTAPLIIFVHGNLFNRHVHEHQAKRLSSWGFHTLVLDVPNKNQWVENGKRVAKIAQLIHGYPQILSSTIDTKKIILAGHSFGGSAVTLAAAHKAPVSGLILLDPAVVHDTVVKAMKYVDVPVVLLGADPKIFRSRRRPMFFKNIRTPMTEVTITGSTHNDAQLPSITTWRWGIDPFTTKAYQEAFLQSIVASSFGLSQHDLRYIWTVMRQAEKKDGILKDAKIRFTHQKYEKQKPHIEKIVKAHNPRSPVASFRE